MKKVGAVKLEERKEKSFAECVVDDCSRFSKKYNDYKVTHRGSNIFVVKFENVMSGEIRYATAKQCVEGVVHYSFNGESVDSVSLESKVLEAMSRG